MDIANVIVALGGDKDNTIPKFNVTAAEIAVLRTLHGSDAVFDIQPIGTVSTKNRDERARLVHIYGNAKDNDGKSIVGQLFPGAAARVFETLDELELPEDFFKAETRVTASTPSPVKAAAPTPKAPEIEPATTKSIQEMTKAELQAELTKRGVTFDPRSIKSDLLDLLEAQPTLEVAADEADGEDGIEDIKDGVLG